MNAKPAWNAQFHFPTSGFPLEPWKVPTAKQKMRMIKDSREEGALSWGRNRLVLSQQTWPCLLVVKDHCDGQKWSRNTEQQVTMLYKCPVLWNTSLSGHPTWKINVLTYTFQRSKLPLPFKKFLLFEHHYLLSQLCKQNRLQVRMVIAFSWVKHD